MQSECCCWVPSDKTSTAVRTPSCVSTHCSPQMGLCATSAQSQHGHHWAPLESTQEGSSSQRPS